MTENALLIEDGVISRITLEVRDGSYQQLSQLIRAHISTCFVVPGYGRGRRIWSWCDDAFLLRAEAEREWNVVLDHTVYNHPPPGYPIGGPIVVTTSNSEGETVAMNELEMSAFHVLPRRAFAMNFRVIELPTLTFRPGYDV